MDAFTIREQNSQKVTAKINCLESDLKAIIMKCFQTKTIYGLDRQHILMVVSLSYYRSDLGKSDYNKFIANCREIWNFKDFCVYLERMAKNIMEPMHFKISSEIQPDNIKIFYEFPQTSPESNKVIRTDESMDIHENIQKSDDEIEMKSLE